MDITVEQVGEGSVINKAYPVKFLTSLSWFWNIIFSLESLCERLNMLKAIQVKLLICKVYLGIVLVFLRWWVPFSMLACFCVSVPLVYNPVIILFLSCSVLVIYFCVFLLQIVKQIGWVCYLEMGRTSYWSPLPTHALILHIVGTCYSKNQKSIW